MYLFSCNAQREISSTLERSVRSSIIQIESTIVSLRCPLVWRVKCGETGTCRVRIVTSSSGLSCAMRSAQLALGTCACDKTVQVLGQSIDAMKVACQRSGISSQASTVDDDDGNKECQQERTSASCPVAIRAAVKAALHISRLVPDKEAVRRGEREKG